MIYRSNLSAPNLEAHFAATTICKPRPWSMGHDVMSDAVYDPECGFMLNDEAAILYTVAQAIGGEWVDIGCRFGWSSAHIHAATSQEVACVDRDLEEWEIMSRFFGNTDFKGNWAWPCTAQEFFDCLDENDTVRSEHSVFSGFMIDGDHDSPQPLNDARGALAHLAETGVIVFHDFWGKPIRDAVQYLINQGMGCRSYDTPAGMAVCWRGDFTPPDHTPDPAIDWHQVRRSRAPEFDFEQITRIS